METSASNICAHVTRPEDVDGATVWSRCHTLWRVTECNRLDLSSLFVISVSRLVGRALSIKPTALPHLHRAIVGARREVRLVLTDTDSTTTITQRYYKNWSWPTRTTTITQQYHKDWTSLTRTPQPQSHNNITKTGPLWHGLHNHNHTTISHRLDLSDTDSTTTITQQYLSTKVVHSYIISLAE